MTKKDKYYCRRNNKEKVLKTTYNYKIIIHVRPMVTTIGAEKFKISHLNIPRIFLNFAFILSKIQSDKIHPPRMIRECTFEQKFT